MDRASEFVIQNTQKSHGNRDVSLAIEPGSGVEAPGRWTAFRARSTLVNLICLFYDGLPPSPSLVLGHDIRSFPLRIPAPSGIVMQ